MHIFTEEPNEYREHSWNRLPEIVPSIVFKTRVKDESLEGSNPYRWQDVNSYDIFAGKRVLLVSLPGAFTPTCDTMQLPRLEELAEDFYAQGFDDIYCISVNDSFVMNKWAQSQKLEHVKVIPDGSAGGVVSPTAVLVVLTHADLTPNSLTPLTLKANSTLVAMPVRMYCVVLTKAD